MNSLNALAGTSKPIMNPRKTAALHRTVLFAPALPPGPDASARIRAGEFTASVRLPVRRTNRAYLRALRAAELAAWEKADQRPRPEPAPTLTTQLRLEAAASASGRRGEIALYGLLVAAVAAMALLNARAGLELVARWDWVVQLVQGCMG